MTKNKIFKSLGKHDAMAIRAANASIQNASELAVGFQFANYMKLGTLVPYNKPGIFPT